MNDKPAKSRLDVLVAARGLAPSRERAQALIMAGLVVVDDHTLTKAGQSVRADAELRLKGEVCPYVSRGGLKLESALNHFALDVNGFVCLDIGASTGGFTDCLLQRGAVRVTTIDVGTNQLAWSLRQDPRITVHENTHVKDLRREDIPEPRIDLIVVDVSFISLALALPPLYPFLAEGAALLAMVKPQFEVGPERIGKGGVVREERFQLEAVERIAALLAAAGFATQPAFPAGIKGPKGNQEYFLLHPATR